MGGGKVKRRGSGLVVWAYKSRFVETVRISEDHPEIEMGQWFNYDQISLCRKVYAKLTGTRTLRKDRAMKPTRVRIPAWSVVA